MSRVENRLPVVIKSSMRFEWAFHWMVLIHFIQEQTSKGIQLNHIMRHTVGLFHGQNGSRTWKQYLSKNMCIRDADLQKVNHIMDQVKKTNPVSLER